MISGHYSVIDRGVAVRAGSQGHAGYFIAQNHVKFNGKYVT